jgi:ribosomal protein S18 acetylase RimI-like enzyme
VSRVDVTRTYLELSRAESAQAPELAPDARIERVTACPISFYRYLYGEVGRDFHWRDRAGWSDERIAAHLARDEISLWVLYVRGAPAGYFELERHDDGSVEIAYFGLLPDYTGRGLGGQMLRAAIERAWDAGAERVWLHTCSLDSPAALPNYLARGFRPYREERYTVEMDEG